MKKINLIKKNKNTSDLEVPHAHASASPYLIESSHNLHKKKEILSLKDDD